MELRFMPVAFMDIAEFVRSHHAVLPAPVDSYLEDHIMASRHYRIEIDGAEAGFASIHGQSLITQFAMAGRHRRYGQIAFRELCRQELVSAAFVPTCDTFYLSHALDDYRQLTKQAYMFVLGNGGQERTRRDNVALVPASADDAAAIHIAAGEFFEHLDERIAAGQIFVTRQDDELVGYGVLLPSAFHDDVASIGMFTNPAFREQGVGTATISLLIAECRARGFRPVAGCAYDNIASKLTLERAGMVSPTRLLRVGF